MSPNAPTDPVTVNEAFRSFVEQPSFSCLAGKGVVHRGAFAIGTYGVLGSQRSTARLSRDLAAFLEGPPRDPMDFRSYVAVFTHTAADDEDRFEQLLWRQLQRLHDADDSAAPWDGGVSDDPGDPAFSFCFAGVALFVVGLAACSSRITRRFRWPALVFNPHDQFHRLRETQRFERVKQVVREREMALQGSLNPNLADFGERSEARQYSGRRAEDDWQCPFHRTQ